MERPDDVSVLNSDLNQSKKYKKSLLTSDDLKDYFYDKFEINFYCCIFEKNDQVKPGLYRLKTKLGQLKVYVSKSDSRILFNYRHSTNLNREARVHIQKKFNLKRTSTLNENGDNFIPIAYREKMIEEGYTLERLRKWMLKKAVLKFIDIKSTLIKSLSNKFNIDRKYFIFETSLSHLSISLDVRLPSGVDLISNDVFQKRLNEHVLFSNQRDYADYDGNALIGLKSVDMDNTPLRKSIKGYTNYKEVFEIYLKEQSKLGNLCRFEIRFKNKKELRKLGPVYFKSTEEFQQIIERCANYWTGLISGWCHLTHNFNII